ncbi:hypothetical protein AYI92_06570 [Shewanella xiamenensis]|nr:hypothetical protein AYI90_06955 [Shewanella xiamenensis]TVL21352.1 hypothetical protein AYI91_07915 [Shewanella xiamenensis]TVL27362.1 hypothetical protein AYI92_06570 [Shewanella xiamenensis]TVL34909.1 hypothetical protein AYI93_07185 [Shewanella xiamenensis]TVL35939.1 hypothetical protein AYI95_00215 [Shewanella xiamenensis]
MWAPAHRQPSSGMHCLVPKIPLWAPSSVGANLNLVHLHLDVVAEVLQQQPYLAVGMLEVTAAKEAVVDLLLLKQHFHFFLKLWKGPAAVSKVSEVIEIPAIILAVEIDLHWVITTALCVVIGIAVVKSDAVETRVIECCQLLLQQYIKVLWQWQDGFAMYFHGGLQNKKPANDRRCGQGRLLTTGACRNELD